MKKAPHLLLILSSFFIFLSHSTNAQTSKKTANYSKHPYWIEMMKDPNANYFETIKAYDTFWSTRKKPLEEDDIIGQEKEAEKKNGFLHRWFKSRAEKEEEESKKYRLDVKKFEHWKLKVKPYVQEDGRILNAEEQLKLWQQK